MPRTIICTAGTTIAKDCPALTAANEACLRWEDDPSDLAQQIESRLAGFKFSCLVAPTDLSTEINSLLLLDCRADDEVVLLAADDAVGRICAEHLAAVVPSLFGMPRDMCKVNRIVGLQMRDTARFRKEGLPDLFQKLLGYLRDPQRRYARGVVLNATGGFKGVVPFLTVLGMLYGARVVYVSRASHQLVSLPPLPLTFDCVVFARAREALEWAERRTVFHSEDFYGRITGCGYEERELFLGFLETDGEDQSTLSSLAQVLMEKERASSGRVWLAPAAMKKIERLAGIDRDHALQLLRRVGDPLWRSRFYHRFEATELDVFGGGALAIRIAGFQQGSDFYVCELFYEDHDAYVTVLRNTRKAHYPAVESFVPLPESQHQQFDTDDLDEPWSKLLTDRDSLRKQIPDLIRQREDAGRRANEALASAEELRQQIARLRRSHQGELAALQRELAALRVTQANEESPAPAGTD